jgi:protein-tyrosine phosphatase
MTEMQRIVPLDGASNVRDLGGYRSQDGRAVRWGVLYRSANLAGLTEAGVAAFGALGLGTICDLRHDAERAVHPTPAACTTGLRVDLLNLLTRQEPEVTRMALGGDAEPAAARALLQSIYRAFPIEHAPVYAALLKRVSDGAQLPLLFHCTAGKDRTGFGAALILRALGVPMETVMADYVLTNAHWRGTGRLNGLPADLRSALGGAHPEYLAASFAAIDEHYGSFDAYLDRALGFGPARVQALRDLLLATDPSPAEGRSVS